MQIKQHAVTLGLALRFQRLPELSSVTCPNDLPVAADSPSMLRIDKSNRLHSKAVPRDINGIPSLSLVIGEIETVDVLAIVPNRPNISVIQKRYIAKIIFARLRYRNRRNYFNWFLIVPRLKHQLARSDRRCPNKHHQDHDFGYSHNASSHIMKLPQHPRLRPDHVH